MADYGLVDEVTAVPQGSFLIEAAAVSDTSLFVATAAEFDPDGGTLDLNGTQLDYTGIEYGTAADDPDELLLVDPLAVAADVDDTVGVVTGSDVAVDYYASVVMSGDGDAVLVKLLSDQVPMWQVGQYDPPVKVLLSDDLLYIVDAPGRTPTVSASRSSLIGVTDTAVAAGPGDTDVFLTRVPVEGTLRVFWEPLHVPLGEWSYDGSSTVTVTESHAHAGDVFSVWYLADGAVFAVADSPVITDPADGSSTTDSTPTISGRSAPGRPIEVFVDGVSIGTDTPGADGEWSFTSGALSLSGHTATATQNNPDGTTSDAEPVDFTVTSPTAATASLRGTRESSGSNGPSLSNLALPTGTLIGDLIVVSAAEGGAAGLDVTDSRLEKVGVNLFIGFATTLADIAVTASGGFGKHWSIACMTLNTNAVGWSSGVTGSDSSMVAGDNLAIPQVGSYGVAVAALTDGHSIVSGYTGTPTGYTTGSSSVPSLSHAAAHFWNNGGSLGTSSSGPSAFAGGDGGAEVTVVGLIGP